MQISTTSKPVRAAATAVLRRLSAKDRALVTGFVATLHAEASWNWLAGIGPEGLDRASAVLAPQFQNNTPPDQWPAHIRVILPVFKLFSARAQIGILAHEMAHAWRAARMGPGWEGQMLANGQAEERAADRIASRWGFAREISALRKERRERVDHHLDRIAPAVERRRERMIAQGEF